MNLPRINLLLRELEELSGGVLLDATGSSIWLYRWGLWGGGGCLYWDMLDRSCCAEVASTCTACMHGRKGPRGVVVCVGAEGVGCTSLIIGPATGLRWCLWWARRMVQGVQGARTHGWTLDCPRGVLQTSGG